MKKFSQHGSNGLLRVLFMNSNFICSTPRSSEIAQRILRSWLPLACFLLLHSNERVDAKKIQTSQAEANAAV
jgi:hypothetical protein